MSHLARQFCVGLAVTLMVALQAFGAMSAAHKIEHAGQFPGVAYEAVSADDHDHDHGRHHDDPSVDAGPGAELSQIDDGDPDSKPVKSHHHHGGADQHLVTGEELPPIDASIAYVVRLGPSPDSVLPGALIDAPHQPPKQNA